MVELQSECPSHFCKIFPCLATLQEALALVIRVAVSLPLPAHPPLLPDYDDDDNDNDNNDDDLLQHRAPPLQVMGRLTAALELTITTSAVSPAPGSSRKESSAISQLRVSLLNLKALQLPDLASLSWH